MTLNEFKVIFWWEYLHRLLGRVIGLVVLIPLLYFIFKSGFKKNFNYFIIFILICFQGFIGWYMVKSGLTERTDVSHYRLSLHLLIAFIILGLTLWSYLKLKNITKIDKKIPLYLTPIFILLVFGQIIIGAFVSGMDAGQIYNTWPSMNGNFFPGDSSIKDLIGINVFNDPSLVQFIHRNVAYLILIIFSFIAYYVFKFDVFFSLRKIIILISFILLCQTVLGILTVLSGAIIYLASLHQIGSIFLVSSSIYLLYKNS